MLNVYFHINRSIGPDAVQRAKRTLRQSYLVVGFTEDLPAFMDVLEILMPNFFSNATNVFNELGKSVCKID